MLTVADEIYLLMLDTRTGRPSPEISPQSVHNAIAGALLMELSLHNRIDTDLQRLFVVDPAPVHEPMLDQVLTLIVQAGDTKPTSFWLDVLAVDGDALATQLGSRMNAPGVPSEGRDGRPAGRWGGHGASVDQVPIVQTRISRIVQNAEVPDPRDIMIISLANACGLWRGLFHERSYERLGARIEQFAKMDLIGREVARILRDERS